MNGSILLASTQYPGYGGAATNTYALIKYLKSKKYNVIGIFFENKDVNVDPECIGNVLRFDCTPFDYKNMIMINKFQNILKCVFKEDPVIMFCKNYKAPTYCKMLYPKSKNIYLVSGICHFSNFFPTLSAQYVLNNDIKIPDHRDEIEAISSSDLAVCNSKISLELFYKIYPKYFEKIYPFPVDTTKEIGSLVPKNNININDKIYDFIVTASILTRSEKNNVFLINILKDQRLSKYSKIIIGNDNIKFKNIPNSTVMDILPHNDLMQYMMKSKILLYPSLTDANPNTVREAIHQKCIALITNNIGYYEKFPEFSVCNNFNENEWIEKMIYLVENYNILLNTYEINFGADDDIEGLIEKFI